MDGIQPATAADDGRYERSAADRAVPHPSLDDLQRRAAPLRLVGSVLAVAAPGRERAAAQLTAAGMDVHIDVIDASYPLAEGVDPSIISAPGTGTADVHLMVRDPLVLLPGLLRLHPAQVTVQLEDFGEDLEADLARFSRECRAAEVSPHLAIAPATPRAILPSLVDLVDGVLVMLSPPGAPGGRADLTCLDGVPRGTTTLTVDGGARPELFGALRAHGVDRVVMGRALTEALS